MNTLASPVRRVLGQKNPNAPLLSPSPRKAQQPNTIASPVRERSNLKRPVSPSSAIPPSSRAGQKRKIHEVEEEIPVESQSSTLSHHPLSQMTGMWSDQSSQDIPSPGRSLEFTKSTPRTALTSFQASQEESQTIEAQFIIHDEPSQRTLDKMVRHTRTIATSRTDPLQHAVALPQSTSQLIPPIRPNLPKDTSQISLSLSSLIDFENDDGLEEDDMDFIKEDAPLPKQNPQTELDSRKEMLLEVSLYPGACLVNLDLTLCATESRNPSYSTSTRNLQSPNQSSHQTLCASEHSQK